MGADMRPIFAISCAWMTIGLALIIAAAMYNIIYGNEDWVAFKIGVTGFLMLACGPLWKLALFGPLDRK